MIPQYTDHSANERTYLAWLRTSIAIIAFGLLIERFDIFLRSIAGAIEEDAGSTRAVRALVEVPPYGRELGMVLAIVGVVAMTLASIRFWRTARRIRQPESTQYDPRMAAVLGGVLLVFGILTLLYALRIGWG